MKMKFFLRGLGIGILVTTLVLCVSYRKQNSDQSVVERARELGMEFPEKSPETMLPPSASPEMAISGSAVAITPEQPQVTPITQVSPSPAPVAATVQPQGNATVQPQGNVTVQPQGNVTPQPVEKPKVTAERKTRTFTVRSGLLSSSVAREMKAAGVIADDEALDDYLEKSGLARKVRAGKYKIPVGASYEEIARIITRQDQH